MDSPRRSDPSQAQRKRGENGGGGGSIGKHRGPTFSKGEGFVGLGP